MARPLEEEARAVALAAELMRLGARRPVVEAETGLSGERLTRLYVEVTGQAPARGQLPHSPAWFLHRSVGLHVALFDGWRRRLLQQAGLSGSPALMTAYRLYREETARLGLVAALDFTRAWSLVRFLGAGLLVHHACPRCGLVHVGAPRAPLAARLCAGCQPSPVQAARQARATASATLMPSTPADRMPPA